jgi:hypothetical protein
MMKRTEVENANATVEGLCRLARKLGYKDPASQLINHDGSVVGDLLYFFDDNPGACEAVIQWVLDEGCDADGNDLEDDEEEDS